MAYLGFVRGVEAREVAIKAATRATQLDPAAAAGHGTLAVERDAGSFAAHWVLGMSLGVAGRFEEAVARLEIAASMTRHPSPAPAIMAGIFARWGTAASAAVIHRDLVPTRENAAHQPSLTRDIAEA